MATVIQAVTIGQLKVIENARWEVPGGYFLKDQRINIELPVNDSHFLTFLSKNPRNECIIDGDKKSYAAVVTCTVAEVRHMLTVSATRDNMSGVDTMVTVTPSNRWVEHVIQYLLNPMKCDPKFMIAVRGGDSRTSVKVE